MTPLEMVRAIASDPEALRELTIAIQQQTLRGLQPSTNDDRWVLSKDAWEPLGLTSYQDLHNGIASGLLRIGTEVIDIRKPGAQRPRYQVNLAKARRRLEQSQEKRGI